MRARDLADEFEIGVRTVYRDMATLAESGVPLRAGAGVGYSLEPGWRLPPLSLTPDEASALLIACRLAGPAEDASTAGSMRSALAKVRSVLASAERDYLERLEAEGVALPVLAIPFSPPVQAQGPALPVSSLEELEAAEISGAIPVLGPELCGFPISPKSFDYYNPEEHRRLVALLEERRPGAAAGPPPSASSIPTGLKRIAS